MLDADEIARAGPVCRRRAPEIALLVSGRQRLPPVGGDDVEIEIADPVLVLRVVDAADRNRDAEPLQRRLVEQRDALRRRAFDQELDRQRLAVLDQLLIDDLVAGFFQQARRCPQTVADVLGIAVDRILIRLRHDLRRNVLVNLLQERHFGALRHARRGKLGALEVAADAAVLPIEQLLVHLLEIEGIVERAADALVLEHLAADVEHERLHAAGVVDLELFLQHTLLGRRREVVGRRPLLRRVFIDPVGLVGLEGFERDRVVAEIFVAQLVEIILADADRQLLAPVILHPLERDRAAGNEVLDPIGTGAERLFERGRADVALAAFGVRAFPPVLRQHRKLPDDLRQLAVAGRIERELHVALAGLFGLHDVTIVRAQTRIEFLEAVE